MWSVEYLFFKMGKSVGRVSLGHGKCEVSVRRQVRDVELTVEYMCLEFGGEV